MTWPTKKLGEVCEIYQPQTITSNEILKEGPFKVFGANGVIGYFSKYNHENAEVLVTCRGATCGTLNMSEPKSWITGNAMVVHPKDEKMLSKAFLFYVLKRSNLLKTITGTGQPQITRNSLAPFQIPLPPLATQNQIVDRLDKIADAQKLNDDLIQKSDELFQSLLHQELNPVGKDWEIKKLENLLDLCDAGVWGKPTKENGILVLRSTNFKNGGLLDFSKVPELKIDEKKRTKAKLKDGDILLEKSGGGPDQPVGRVVYFITPDQRDYTFANFIQRLRVSPDVVNSNFLFYHLLRLHNIGYTKKLQSQTTGIRNLKLSLYLKTGIPLPPIKTQKQIVAKLSAVQEYKTQLLAQKSKLKELFDSALAKSMNR